MKSPVYFPSLSLESCSVIFLPEFSILDLEPQMWDIYARGKKSSVLLYKPSRKTSGNGRTKLLGNCHDNRLLHRQRDEYRKEGGENFMAFWVIFVDTVTLWAHFFTRDISEMISLFFWARPPIVADQFLMGHMCVVVQIFHFRPSRINISSRQSLASFRDLLRFMNGFGDDICSSAGLMTETR